jgi:hypothetical protein
MASVNHILDYVPAANPAVDPSNRIIQRDRPVRGIGWVLKWAAAICVLSTSAVILLNLAYRLAAERALVQAATAGIREAALPRASRRSVEQSIRRELANYIHSERDVSISLQLAGKPVMSPIASRSSGHLSVTVSLPADAAFPSWLRVLCSWNRYAVIATQVD